MGSLGSLIFLLVIVAQGVSAVVVALKKRQQAREAERAASEPTIKAGRPTSKLDGPTIKADSSVPPTGVDPAGEARSTVTPASTGDSMRNDVVQRRRQQIEELRQQARERKAGQIKTIGKTDKPARISAEIAPSTRAPATASPKPAPPPGGRLTISRVPDVTQFVQKPALRTPPKKSRQEPALSAKPAAPLWGATNRKSAGKRRLRSCRKLLDDRGRLRELIVLKEVLDPPVSLRDESDSLG